MRAGVRSWIALGLAMLVAAAIVGWRACGRETSDRQPRSTRVRARGLDVAAFRAELAARLSRAKAVAQQPRAKPAPASPQRTSQWPSFGKGPFRNAGTNLIEPQCTIGPRELCTLLDPLVRGCDAGDASDCLAVGQHLADTPPRGLVAVTFFVQACRIGEPAGCERLDELRSPSQVACELDPFACSHTALRTQDRELHDQACSHGAADSCSFMAFFTEDDVELSRGYLERACQLGLPMACAELGHRLQPDCVEIEGRSCYPPDPAEASTALEIACAAGWSECKQPP